MRWPAAAAPSHGALTGLPSSTHPFVFAQLDDDEAAERDRLRFEAAYQLLGTATNAPPHEATAAERREWLALAAAAFRSGGRPASAAPIEAALGRS